MSNGKDEFDAAYAAHRPMLLGLARRFLPSGRGEEAPDFVQETMVRFISTYPAGPPPGMHCGKWLAKTITNLLIGDWRQKKVRAKAESNPALYVVAAPEPAALPGSPPVLSMAEVAERKLSSETYKLAVASLSDKLRAVYELHVLGYTHQQISERLGLSGVAVRKRLHDARKQLGKQLRLSLDEDVQ